MADQACLIGTFFYEAILTSVKSVQDEKQGRVIWKSSIRFYQPFGDLLMCYILKPFQGHLIHFGTYGSLSESNIFQNFDAETVTLESTDNRSLINRRFSVASSASFLTGLSIDEQLGELELGSMIETIEDDEDKQPQQQVIQTVDKTTASLCNSDKLGKFPVDCKWRESNESTSETLYESHWEKAVNEEASNQQKNQDPEIDRQLTDSKFEEAPELMAAEGMLMKPILPDAVNINSVPPLLKA
ncbi:unnamed protein product [Protopolystoma xenopodis]|uniref:Uncharacterized protein n=1 Tax=Protopolystoma xenopodis TaxID=117903 RepID=A0A448WFC6_9PLAT|nr:unnamed protein product [Protopolystoma xenopodis]